MFLCGDLGRIKNYAAATAIFPESLKWVFSLLDSWVWLFSFFYITRQETKIPGGLVQFQHLATPMLPPKTKDSRGPGFTSKLRTYWLWQEQPIFNTALSEHSPPFPSVFPAWGGPSNTLGLRLENWALSLTCWKRCSRCGLCPVTQSCSTLCGPVAPCIHQVPLVCGIFQARILEWLPLPPPGDPFNPEIKPESPESLALTGGFFTTTPPVKPRGQPNSLLFHVGNNCKGIFCCCSAVLQACLTSVPQLETEPGPQQW